MTFLNATLIFGIAAIAVPIALHFLAKREPRRVVFPSVAFLTKRFHTNRSRLRVRRWWLLALRIAALAALALALARPAIHRSLSVTWLTIALIAGLGVALLVMATVAINKDKSRSTALALVGASGLALMVAMIWGVATYASGPSISLDQMEPVAIAIVLDNSPTSAWKTSDDDRMKRMKDLATWMVTRLPATSRIAIIDRSAQPATFSLDVSSAISKIEQSRPRELATPIASRMESAIRLVRTSELPKRQVLLITDLATASWQGATTEDGLSASLAEDPAVELTVFDLGDFAGSNRSLSIPKFTDATPPRGSPVALTTVLSLDAPANSGQVSATIELEMFQNDPALPVVRNGIVTRPAVRSVDRTSASIAPDGAVELLMTIPALETGTHHGQIRLIGDDAVSLDDVRYFTLQVLPSSRVLLVCDDEDEANALTKTVNVSFGVMDDANAEFIVERIAFKDFSVVQLANFDAVCLIDPPIDVLSDELLAEYANAGGGVLVSLGPAAGEEPVESSWLPRLVRRWRAPPPGRFFEVIKDSSFVTQAVSRDTPWPDFRVYQYWQLESEDSDTVLVQYAGTDHPAVLERLIRADDQVSEQVGRVILVTTPIPALAEPTRSWNELFQGDFWPAWILTRQSIEYLTRRNGDEAMSLIGQPQMIRWQDAFADEDVDAVEQTRRIQLFPPGNRSPVPLNVPIDAQQLTTTDNSTSGVYWLRGLEPGAGFSVNLPSGVTDLDRLETSDLDQIFGPEQFRVASEREQIEFAESQSTSRVSLHSPAMLLVLIVFLLEQLLSNRFYKSSNPSPQSASA